MLYRFFWEQTTLRFSTLLSFNLLGPPSARQLPSLCYKHHRSIFHSPYKKNISPKGLYIPQICCNIYIVKAVFAAGKAKYQLLILPSMFGDGSGWDAPRVGHCDALCGISQIRYRIVWFLPSPGSCFFCSWISRKTRSARHVWVFFSGVNTRINTK